MRWYQHLFPYRVAPDLLEAGDLDALRADLSNSPYMAGSDLSNRFEGTYGFSVVFQRSGLPRVLAALPAMRPYLEAVLDDRCNAFYINPLVIYQGAGVAAHADRTLLTFTLPAMVPYPLKTSVLYVDVPQGLVGGELVLYFIVPFARVRPQANTLVEFLGSLRHSVRKVESSPDGKPRISLVCEQYTLKPETLEKIPEFFLSTDRKFKDFLEAELDAPKL